MSEFSQPNAMIPGGALAPFAPDPASRRIWMKHLERVTLRDGETLFRQGDPAEAMFLVESGQVAVMLEVAGAPRVMVRKFGQGQFLGEMALYRSEPRTATVEAVGEATLWRLATLRLNAMERSHPDLALAWHREVAASLGERVSFGNVELMEPLARLAHAMRGLAASDFAESGWDREAVAQAADRDDEVGELARAMEFFEGRLRTYLAELRPAPAADPHPGE